MDQGPIAPVGKLPPIVDTPTNYLKEQEVLRVQERNSRLEFAKVLRTQVLEKSLEKVREQKAEEQRVQIHVHGNYFRPQPVYRFKKLKEYSSARSQGLFSSDPISGRSMPTFPAQACPQKNKQFAFDKWSKPTSEVYNSLPIGTNHVVPQTGERFPRIATDVVYRATRRNHIQVSKLDGSRVLPGGVTRSQRASEVDLRGAVRLEKLIATDWNRYY
jgi:hypothetical protein